jgi:polyisoprenoid-binding protein YceI
MKAVLFVLARCFALTAFLVGFSPAAFAERESYYAPPSQVMAGILLGYSDAFSQDYINLNQNPMARFTSATAGFHYNRDKNTISNLRASISAGSVASPDKDFTWILINQGGLNVNQFEEIVLFSTQPAAFDHENKAVIEGYMTMRGITSPVKIEARMNYLQDNNIITGSVLGERGAIGLSLNINFKCLEFGMSPVDNNGKSRGDIASLKLEMRAIKQ